MCEGLPAACLGITRSRGFGFEKTALVARETVCRGRGRTRIGHGPSSSRSFNNPGALKGSFSLPCKQDPQNSWLSQLQDRRYKPTWSMFSFFGMDGTFGWARPVKSSRVQVAGLWDWYPVFGASQAEGQDSFAVGSGGDLRYDLCCSESPGILPRASYLVCGFSMNLQMPEEGSHGVYVHNVHINPLQFIMGGVLLQKWSDSPLNPELDTPGTPISRSKS